MDVHRAMAQWARRRRSGVLTGAGLEPLPSDPAETAAWTEYQAAAISDDGRYTATDPGGDAGVGHVRWCGPR